MNSPANWVKRPPNFLRLFFPSVLWRVRTTKREVYLTFDDGPVPGVTPWVIDLLKTYGYKATFFCVGDNIRKYPGIYEHLKQAGMEVANHSFSHKPGHPSGFSDFLKDLDQGWTLNRDSKWFRPPHGIVFPWWIRDIRKRGQKVVMWDVLSGDYNRKLTPEKVFQNVVKNLRPGSIIVFHDSLKAWPNLKEALPMVLLWMKNNGYSSDILSSINQNKAKL